MDDYILDLLGHGVRGCIIRELSIKRCCATIGLKKKVILKLSALFVLEKASVRSFTIQGQGFVHLTAECLVVLVHDVV